jgi:microcystin-dependent protein
MEGMIGEVRMFGGNFAPRTWALCDGQLLPISQNTALFSIIGTIYGGDGRTTFALPDIRGRAVLGPGNGPGLSSYREGQRGGGETVIMTTAQMPSHSHSSVAKATATGTTADPNGATFATLAARVLSTPPANAQLSGYAPTSDANMNAGMVRVINTGGQQSINNMMPYQTVNYIICLQGIFPSRS